MIKIKLLVILFININENTKPISGGNGYAVNGCRIVNEDEYNEYLNNLQQWQNIVDKYFIDYYNFFE